MQVIQTRGRNQNDGEPFVLKVVSNSKSAMAIVYWESGNTDAATFHNALPAIEWGIEFGISGAIQIG